MSDRVPQIPVLSYHHVHDGPDDFFRTWPDVFRRQMELLLREGYVPVAPAQLQALAGRGAAERHAMVTFDDGYLDFAEHAWPVLRSLGIPATLFVISGRLGGWNDWDDLRWAPHRHLDEAQVRQLAAEGVVIGSHSRSHPVLVQLDADALETELRGSQDDLERLVGVPVRAIAYPGGAVDDAVRRAASAVYDLGFATQSPRDGATCDRFLVPRFDPCFFGDLEMFRRELLAHSGFGRR